MPDHDLHKFMAQVTTEMASEYDRIYARTKEDPGTAGDEGEENWASLFRDWLPPAYQVMTKGRLIGHDGRMSPQIDLVILKPSYPRKLMEKRVWIADGVAAAFECKNTLTAANVRESVKRCIAFKDLFKERTGSPRHELTSPLLYGLLAHSHSWKGEKSKPIENIINALDEETIGLSHPKFNIDLICVADLAAWSSTYSTRYLSSWSPENQAKLENVFGGPWGLTTAFICASYQSENQNEYFRPIGALIAQTVQKIARNDPSVRDIADYYRLANLWGSGSGLMRFWPPTVLSPEVRKNVELGSFFNEFWGDWFVAGF